MTKSNTKRALLSSVLAMILCLGLLIGTTFAWFTDSVTSSGNKIKAGTLDIQLLMDGDVDGTYDDISNSTSPIFGEDSIAQNNNAQTLWEPGKTQVAYLAIKNNGQLALKYTVGLDVQNVSKDLYEVMEYAIVPDADANHKVTSWTSGNSVEVGTQSVSGDVSLPVGATHYFALVIHMDEEAGNEYQGGEVNFDLTVLATQDTVESDSFNNPYDKDAVYGDVMVSSDAELKAAIEDPAMKVIAVNGDLTYDWGSESYENSKALNMKGKIFLGANDAASITFAGYGSANPIVDATFRNITIKDSTVGDNEASWENGYLEFKNLTAVNVTFANSIMMEGDFATFKNCSFNSNKDGEYAVWVANGDATFEGCTFTGPRGVKVHEAYGSEVGTVVIDNNTFAGLTQKPGVAIGTVNAATTIKITNNVFAATQPGDQNNYKYETDTDVTTFNFVDENNTENGALITTADQLAAVLASTGKNITAVLAADIDLPITSLGSITAGSGEYKLGSANTEAIVIDLNGHKLNITTTYWSALGAVNPDATITIKNGSMTSTGNSAGTWNAWDLRFSNCDWNFEDVVFEKAVALDNVAKVTNMKNVTITDSHNTDTYALWITAEGQTVNIDGLTIDMLAATDGRGIKIDEQYVAADSVAKVKLTVKNATFKTEEKSAILVKSVAGADITLENVDISGVAADTTNAVWNDSDAAASFDKVTVTGGTKIQKQ